MLNGMNTTALIKSILFTIFMPGTIAILIPFLLLILESNRFDLGYFKYIGGVIICLGVVFYFTSVFSFVHLGGTPQIFFMKKLEKPFGLEPDALASNGIYSFSRNPMYSGVFLTLFGESILFESLYVLVLAILFFIIVNFVVIYIEEPHLKELHGQEYKKYLANTPRWLGFRKK